MNNHPRQQQQQQQQQQHQMGPPQLVIARPRGDGFGTSPPEAPSPQFPTIPPFAGASAREPGLSPMETPASSSQSQPQLKYHKQVCYPLQECSVHGTGRQLPNPARGHITWLPAAKYLLDSCGSRALAEARPQATTSAAIMIVQLLFAQ